MKFPRGLLVVLALAAALVAILVVAGFVPAVQRWVVLKAVASRTGVQLDVDRLVVRAGSLKVHNLRYDQKGVRIAVADAAADFSLWEIIAHRRAIVRDARITGLKVDITNAALPVAAESGTGARLIAPVPVAVPTTPGTTGMAGQRRASPEPIFDGIIKHLHLPMALVLDACRVDGEVVFLPMAGRSPIHVRFDLNGSNLGPGQEAKFSFDAVVQNADAQAPVDTVETEGTVSAAVDAQSMLERVGIHLHALASGPQLSAPARLQAGIMLARTSVGETGTLILNSLEAGAERRLLDVKLNYTAGSARLAGSWQVQVGKRQMAPFVLGARLPEFSVAGEGQFELDSITRDVRLAGRLAADVEQVGFIDDRLREMGKLGATGTFDMDFDGNRLRVSELVAKVSGRKPAFSLRAIQPFSIELASQKLAAANPDKELVQVEIQGVPIAWLRPFTSSIEITGDELKGAFLASLRGERVWLRSTSPLTVRGLALKQANRVLLPASDASIEAEVEYAKAETRIKLGKLTLETAADDRLDARGELSLKSGAASATSVQVSFEAVLPTLLAAYAPVGPVKARGDIAWSFSGGAVQVDRLDAHLLKPDGRTLVELNSPEPFSFNIAQWSIGTNSGVSGEVLRVKFGHLPLNWLRTYVGPVELEGDLTPGEIAVRTQGGMLHTVASAPLRVEGFSVGGNGSWWLKDLNVDIEPVVECSSQGVLARLATLRVRNAANTVLLFVQGEATVGPDFAQPKVRGTADFELAVPALAGQPIMGAFTPPAQGKVSGDAKFTFDHDLLGEGRLTLNGLVSPLTREPLPVVNLSFRAGVDEKGEVALQVPVLIDRSGERSDITLAATSRPTEHGRKLDGKISSQHFVLGDVLTLARAFATPVPGAAGDQPAAVATGNSAGGGITSVSEPAPPRSDLGETSAPGAAQAAWAGLTGQLTLDLKSLVVNQSAEVTDLGGRLVIDSQRLALENLTGRVGGDGQLQLSAEARFAPGEPKPYTSRVDLNVREFEVGSIFKSVSPEKSPTIEGRFNVRSQAEGAGQSLIDVIERTRGDFVLQSRRGVFRGLQRAPGAGRSSGIVSGTAKILGTLGVADPHKVENLAAGTDVTAALAGQLADVQYDQLNVRFSRDASLNVKLTDFTLVSPIIRLQGDGLISPEPGKRLLDQPVRMHVNMGVTGAVEAMIAKSKLPVLSKERDELGFRKLREPFVIGGTMARPDPSQLYSILGRSLLDMILP